MSLRFSRRETVSCLTPKLARQVDLRAVERTAQVAQGHFLGDQLSGAGVDLGASLARQAGQLVLEAYGHHPSPSRAMHRNDRRLV